MSKFLLIILDGFGLSDKKEGNAVALANTPNLDLISKTNPMSSIETSGKYVGLPDRVMGNSEVGHMNIGAGRIVKQDLVRINDDIDTDQLKDNSILRETLNYTKEKKSTLHLMGLVSDGAVHSHINHFKYILRVAKNNGIKSVNIHAFTDGRDTAPNSGVNFLKDLNQYVEELGLGEIMTICGRYYAMDRDNRWERNKLAYKMLAYSDGDKFDSINEVMLQSYADGISDEFIKPKVHIHYNGIKDGDAVFCMNFRADRMRQLSKIFTDSSFDKFKVGNHDIKYISMTKYHDQFNFPVLYSPIKLSKIFPEILSNKGLKQLRIAETEKYAHVTYFFNGGEENMFAGEDRVLVPSPKVSTYDLKPEMSAYELTEKITEAMLNSYYDAIIINYANPDMVGHTGNLQAAIKAIEVVDECIGKLVKESINSDYSIFLTADHGNLEMMLNLETNEIHTAHTTLPVPLYMVSKDKSYSLHNSGKLADIAPTILDYMQIDIPKEMTGNSLLIKNK